MGFLVYYLITAGRRFHHHAQLHLVDSSDDGSRRRFSLMDQLRPVEAVYSFLARQHAGRAVFLDRAPSSRSNMQSSKMFRSYFSEG